MSTKGKQARMSRRIQQQYSSDEYVSVDWDLIAEEVSQEDEDHDRTALRNKETDASTSKMKQYVRKKLIKGSKPRSTESAAAEQRDTYTPLTDFGSFEERHASVVPATSGIGASLLHRSSSLRSASEHDATVSSLYQEQQRLSSNQDRMSREMQSIIENQRVIRKKCSKLSSMVKSIFDSLGCYYKSEDSD